MADLAIALESLPGRLHAVEGWGALRAALDAGQSGTIDGTWGSAGALAVAALADDAPGTLVVVLPGASDLPHFVEDLASFTGSRPTIFEAWESWPPPTHKGKLDPATTTRLRLLQALPVDPRECRDAKLRPNRRCRFVSGTYGQVWREAARLRLCGRRSRRGNE